MPSAIRFLFIAVFAIAIMLRAVLCLVNREANDNHFEVIQLILSENRIPGRSECFECFQPKLYHYAVARTIKILHCATPAGQIITAQFINGIAGTATVVLSFLYLMRFASGGYLLKLIVFAFLALNPALIAINAQATNDTFIIFFGSLAIFLTSCFLQKKSLAYFLLLTASAIGAAVSKGNGLVVIPILLIALAGKLLSDIATRQAGIAWHRRIFDGALYFLAFALVCALVVPPLGSYTSKRKYFDTSTPIVGLAGHPAFFKETFMSGQWPQRPGVTSVVHAYATFRILDLLQHPILTVWDSTYPRHRTSLWTQLYARAHFVQFDSWPLSWKMIDWRMAVLGRMIYLLALIPLLVFFIGMARACTGLINTVISRQYARYLAGNDWFYLLSAVVYLSFIAYFTWAIRDYSAMKPVFIYPALFCFISIFAEGINFCHTKWRQLFLYIVVPLLTGLLLLEVTDIVLLINHLFRNLYCHVAF
jgi:hypothetical protein